MEAGWTAHILSVYLPMLQFCWMWPSLAAKEIWTESVKHEVLCDAFGHYSRTRLKQRLVYRVSQYQVDGPHEAYKISVQKLKKKYGNGWTLVWEATANAVKWDHGWWHWGEGCSTSEARDFNWIQRASFGTCLSWLHWPFPFPKAAWVLKLVGGEDESDEVAQKPPPVLLGRVHSLVPLFARYVHRIAVQQLLASLKQKNIFSLPVEPASQKPKPSPFQRQTCFLTKWLRWQWTGHWGAA